MLLEIRDLRDLCPCNQEGDVLQAVGSPLRGQGRAARTREEDGIDMNGWKPDQAAPGCFESVGFSALSRCKKKGLFYPASR